MLERRVSLMASVAVIALLVLLLVAAWAFRYEVQPLRGFVVAKHDRWTGRTYYCEPQGCFEPRQWSSEELRPGRENPLIEATEREKAALPSWMKDAELVE